MLGLYKYIEQKYPSPKWSEIYFLKSTTGSPAIASDNDQQRGARGIVYHAIYCITNPKGSVIAIKDQFNKEVIVIDTSANTYIPFAYTQDGTVIKLTATFKIAPVVPSTITFYVSYQYIL